MKDYVMDLKEHLESVSVFKGTLCDIQNDLISAISDVLITEISNEIEKSDLFVVVWENGQVCC